MTTNPNVHFVTVDQLTLSPHNVRQTVAEGYVDELADSIREIGLIQSLAGVKSDGQIEIVAGGCRLRALKQIAEQDGNAEFMEVPVIIAPDVETAKLWSSAENEARRVLKPGSLLRMARNLTAKGHKVSEISKIIATPPDVVRKYLKLASLPDDVIEALDADQIDFEQAKALTIAPDEEALRVGLAKAIEGENSWQIRKLYASELTSRSTIVKFVGLDEIEAAGIQTRRDLFEDITHVDDPAKVQELADKRMKALLDAFEADGWSWATWDNDVNGSYEVSQKYRIGDPDIVPLEDADRAEYERMSDLNYWDLDDEEQAKMDEYEDAIKENGWSMNAKSVSGVVLYFSYNGEIQIVKGCVKKGDLKAAAEAGIVEAPKESATDGDAAKPDTGPFSNALREDLRLTRLFSLRTALLDKPTLAMTLMAFDFAPGSGRYSDILDKQSMAPQFPSKIDGLTVDSRLDAEEGFVSSPSDMGKAFRDFSDGGKKHVNEMIALRVAQSLTLYGTKDMMATLEDMAGCSMRDVWTPTVENFLGRVKVDYLDDLFTELTGMKPDAFEPYAALKKKAAKAEALAGIFAHDEAFIKDLDLTADQWAMIDTWTPELD